MPVRHSFPHVPASLGAERRGAWNALIDGQYGIIDTRQLESFGIGRGAITAEVDAGRWQWVLPRVYAVFTGVLPRAASIVAALRYGGSAAVLSHRTAAEEWHMVPIRDGPVHLTVPYTASAVSHDGRVVVHRSRAHRHITVKTDPPRTSRADTAVDLAVEEADARRARQVLTDLMTNAKLRPVDVQERLEERPPRRHRRALLAAVSLVRHGVQSVLEELYAIEVEQVHGLPPARRQAPFVVDGITLYEDAVYDHIGVPLTVRLDGRTHLRDDVAFRDRRRDNAAELAGRSRLTFGWKDVDDDPCGAASEVERVLRRRGWTGQATPCPRCPAGREW